MIRRRVEDTTQDAPRVCGSQLLQVLEPRAKSVKLASPCHGSAAAWLQGTGRSLARGEVWSVGEVAPGVLLCLAWMLGQQADEFTPFAG